MAYEVIWLPAAVGDLSAIESYIAAQSMTYAGNVIRRILSSSDRLASFPLMGRIVPEVEEMGLRELIVYNYRMIYRADKDGVKILAVIHGARLLRNALEGRTL